MMSSDRPASLFSCCVSFRGAINCPCCEVSSYATAHLVFQLGYISLFDVLECHDCGSFTTRGDMCASRMDDVLKYDLFLMDTLLMDTSP